MVFIELRPTEIIVVLFAATVHTIEQMLMYRVCSHPLSDLFNVLNN